MKEKKKENNNPSKVNINWYPGHMAKTKREIQEDLRLIDVVIELLDARIPISSRNPDFDNIIKNKKRIVILNKSDLSNEIENKRWIEYYNSKNIPALAVDSNSGKGVNKIEKEIEKLMSEDIEKMQAKGIVRKTIRVMILGIPNVGKSSFINRISKKTTMEVGNRPGVTRQKQWIRIGNQIELLDTPGVLWPKFDENTGLMLAYTGSIKDDILDRIDVAYNLTKILVNNHKKLFMDRYKLSEEKFSELRKEDNYALEFMYEIGRKRGALISGGEIDLERVSGIILDDFRSGRTGKITLEVV